MTEDRQQVKFAVVGLGYWGPNLVRVLSELQGAEIAWVCDLDTDRLEVATRRFPAVRATTQLQDILDDDSVDVVAIATPVGTHFHLAQRCLLAGKHTFVEKPLASSVTEADTLMRTAKEQDRILLAGHTFLYSPAVRQAADIVRSGELGQVFFVSSSRVNLGLHQQDVSVIWDLAPHDFSILLAWLGEVPTTVRAVGRDSVGTGIADVAFITMTFPSGVVANVELSWLAPSKLRRTVVVGSEKMVVYEDGAPEPIRVFDRGVVYQDPETFGEYHLSYRTGDVLSPKLDTYEPLAEELGSLIEAVNSGERMRHEADIARDVVLMVAAADASLQAGGREVALAQRPLTHFEHVERRRTDRRQATA